LKRRENTMAAKARAGRIKRMKGKPVVAPGFEDDMFWEDADEEDIRRGNYTKVSRVYLDENDPS
jgi:hypothetical protein